jgi:ABC-type antimicrobial peptide transport system permease subunit
LYAVQSFALAQRRREMGIRLAIGGTPGDVRRLVFRESLRPALIGTAAGLGLAWWALQFLQSYLHQIDARDPWTLALVAVVLIATAFVAAWIPARRAARTDPAIVLRST